MNLKSKLTLVGAGPGDPDLLTIKGMKALESADVILYDALVNTALLDHCPTHSLKIFVGKRADHHTFSQSEINTLCVRYALSHGHVVRLKGGDPFVFGRGHEELLFARAHNIPVEIVPGITSAIAAPAAVGIPVTRRGMSDSFWVITGTTTEGLVSHDLLLAAKTDATIVILMGLGNLSKIVETFKAEGKPDLPIAIIQNATLPNQVAAFGSIETIIAEVEHQNIKAPAVIIIGKVAANSFADLTANSLAETPTPLSTTILADKSAPPPATEFAATNQLFPIFLKLNQLRLLIIGGGYVATEKITAVLENSPETAITLVAPEIREDITNFAAQHPNLKLVYKPYDPTDLDNKDIIIVATNDKPLNRQIKAQATARGILTNVADTPDECDFYLGSVVRKGSLKIAISTNGKSPTMSKRIREALSDVFPDELEQVFDQLRAIRLTLKNDFEEKVRKLNEITAVMTKP